MSVTRALTSAIAASLLLAACSGGTNGTDTVPDTTATTSSSTTSTVAPTTTLPTSSTTTTTTLPVVTDDEVLAAWNAYWTVWARQRASDPIDRGALEEVASPEVVDGAIAFFEKERENGAPLIVPRVYPSGTVTEVSGESATVEACTLISRPPTGVPGSLYDVAMEQTANGTWIVAELALVSGAGCVPTALAVEAIDAYEAYWDDRGTLSNPADPDAPWLAERMTGEHLEVLAELYRDLQERGLYFTGRPETHPEVVEVDLNWSVVILDCMAIPSDWGVYVIDTGQRTDDAESVGDGRLDLRSALMENEMADASGVWRVATLAGEVNASCDFAPTENGLPQS